MNITFSQERKIIQVERFMTAPKIDGVINDIQWKKSIPATKFERWMPNNGSYEKKDFEHFVYMGLSLIHI